MSATNVTTYYEFPVFVGSDKPAWLVDWNGAMNAIDSAIHEAKAEADANATSITSLQSDVTSLAGSVSSQGSSITSLTQSLTSLQGTVNTITSLIGNGEPTTQDKTIIGAINELKADIDALDPSGQGVQAENVGYDNTDSGLTATNVQDAIDELAQGSGGTVEADDVTYDNTQSGLTATDVQSAIDELAQGSASHAYSSTEKAIGTFNNKTVYEKTFTGTATANTNTTVDASLTLAYVDDILDLNLVVKTVAMAYNQARFDTANSNFSQRAVINSSGLVAENSAGDAYTYVITVRYTKA